MNGGLSYRIAAMVQSLSFELRLSDASMMMTQARTA